MDLRTSALLVVDLQNDTVGEQGAFADAGAADFATRHGVLEKARQLVDAARAAGPPVIFVSRDDLCRDGADFGSKASLATPIGGRAGSAGAAVLINSRKSTHIGTGALAWYEVVLATDATATISDEWQQAALSYALTRIAELRTVDELVRELAR